MYKNLKISLSLKLFQFVFTIFKLFPLKKKTTLVTEYGINTTYVANEIKAQTDEEIVILKTETCLQDFDRNAFNVILFNQKKLFSNFKSIYHLATSRYVIVDSDFIFLAATPFKPETKCIQLWHATGSVKSFGLFKRKSPIYKKVFDRMDYIITGSELMTSFYKDAFNDSDNDRFINTGVPRTDFFFNDLARKQIKNQLEIDFPMIKEKTVILYAPTYREYELDQIKFEKHLDKLYKELKQDYVIFLSLHPKDDMIYKNRFPGFIYNVTSHPNINEIAIGSDLLVTDYSPILFEYSLLHKPIVFYAFDLEEFQKARELTIEYESFVPGPVVQSNTELIERIKENNFDLDIVKSFAEEWNEYSVGNSSANLIDFLYKTKK